MHLKFYFNIDEEEVEELKIGGKFMRSKENKVGIEWMKEEGNDFWLTSIIKNLNENLKVLE